MAGLKFFFSIIIFLFSLLIAIIASLGMLASYINPSSSGFIALAGVFLPFSLLTNFFFIIYWLITKKKWWIISLLPILLNTNYLLSVYQFNSPKTNTYKKREIIIASNNVHRFLTNHQITFHSVAAWATEEKIDIICFQEYSELHFSSDSIQKIFNLYPFHAILSERKELCVFCKHPIIRFQKIDFQSNGQGVWIDILYDNDTIRIFNVHLQTTNISTNTRQHNLSQKTGNHPDKMITLQNTISDLKYSFKERAKQAILLRQIIDTTVYPVIICGDFNDTPASYTYHKIKGKYIDGFRQRGNGYGFTFKGLGKLLRIDYILYSKHFTGLQYTSPETEWSDHNPVIMKLSYKP